MEGGGAGALEGGGGGAGGGEAGLHSCESTILSLYFCKKETAQGELCDVTLVWEGSSDSGAH